MITDERGYRGILTRVDDNGRSRENVRVQPAELGRVLVLLLAAEPHVWRAGAYLWRVH